MSSFPKHAEWYIADVIVEVTIEHDSRNVVHTNTLLIHADSPEDAFQKALALGEATETSYRNSDGHLVTMIFRGLQDLNVVDGPLEHGTELLFEEDIDVPEERLQSWITPKDQLGVFASGPSSAQKPNYVAESVVQAMEQYGFTREELR